MKHLGDITQINGGEIPVVDVITGGSPCQDLSIGGFRQGLAGERSGLFMEQMRVVKEMRNKEIENGKPEYLAKPRFIIWENVRGAFSSNSGYDFQTVLNEIVKICVHDAPNVPMPEGGGRWTTSGCLYDEMGRWSIAWRLHNSEFWGVPQRRERIALVSDFGGLCAPEVLFERKGLHWYPDEIGEKGKAAPRDYEASIGQTDRVSATLKIRGGNIGGGKGPLVQWERSGTLSTLKEQTLFDWRGTDCGVRNFTPIEEERVQGFPDGWTDAGDYIASNGKTRTSSDTARHKALGNSIAMPFWEFLARRICAQYERPVTMGSLFDGIGGFPLAFSKAGAIPVWASEIADFPIAVTKARFGDK